MSSQHKSKPVLADDTPMVTDGTPMVTGDTPVVTDGAPTVTGDRTHLVADGTPVVASDTPPMAGGTSLVADGTPVVADGTPILADADLATALYNKGIYTNQNFEGLNLSQPQLVRSTLHEFKKAGAQILHTNTLAASRTHLQAFDLQHKQSQIIDAACQLALDVAQNTDAAQNEAAAQNTGTAQNEIFVAGAVRLQALTPSEALEASKTNHPSPNLPPALQDFNQQVETLLKHPLQALALWTPPCWLTLEAGLQELQRLQSQHNTRTPLPVMLYLDLSVPTAGAAEAPPSCSTSASASPQNNNEKKPSPAHKLTSMLKNYAQLATKYKVAVAGLRGSRPLDDWLQVLQLFKQFWSGPIALRPAAPPYQTIGGHTLQLSSPDTMAKYAKRFIQAGAQIVGTSSGLGSEHLRGMANSVKMLSAGFACHPSKYWRANARPAGVACHPNKYLRPLRGRQHADACDSTQSKNNVGAGEGVQPSVQTSPPTERSLLGQKLFSQQQVVSVEIVPPPGIECEKFFARCQELVDGGVEFVNIPDSARALARMSSLQMAAYVKRHFKLEPIPHFTTRDRNLIGLQADLVGAFVNGVRNVLAVTGDPPKIGDCPSATAVYDVDAIGLSQLMHSMNTGQSINQAPFGRPTEFLVGVALNPMAANTELEIQRLQAKLQAGADFIITQPIYDAPRMKEFLDRAGPIDKPLIMGLWPLVSARNAEFLKNEVPGVFVPQYVVDKMRRAGPDKNATIKCGVDIAIDTLQKAKGWVQGFQVSAPFNRVDVALQVVHATNNN